MLAGATLHSLLKIEVTNKQGTLKDLSDVNLSALRFAFAHCKLIIVDEISMMSNSMLAKVHLRLQVCQHV